MTNNVQIDAQQIWRIYGSYVYTDPLPEPISLLFDRTDLARI